MSTKTVCDRHLHLVLDEIDDFTTGLQNLICFVMIPLPLSGYYFAGSIFGPIYGALLRICFLCFHLADGLCGVIICVQDEMCSGVLIYINTCFKEYISTVHLITKKKYLLSIWCVTYSP